MFLVELVQVANNTTAAVLVQVAAGIAVIMWTAADNVLDTADTESAVTSHKLLRVIQGHP